MVVLFRVVGWLRGGPRCRSTDPFLRRKGGAGVLPAPGLRHAPFVPSSRARYLADRVAEND